MVPPGVIEAVGPTVSGDAISNFAIADGHLVKTVSDMKMNLKGSGGKDSPTVDANVKLEANLLES